MQRTHLLAIFLLSLASAGLHSAENPVASVQRALKDLGFFHAEPGGQLDEETRNALRRFQIRTGLKPTGEVDFATLEALAKSTATAPRELGAEPAPQSVRERALQTEISDREFLARLENREGGVPSASSPAAPTAAPAANSRPPRSVATSPEAPGSGGVNDELQPATVVRFVESYLRAAEARRPDEELSFYAEYVDYFDSGRVSRQFVAKDQASYYRRWPNREFQLADAPQLLSSNGKQATVRFRMRYKVSSGQERASGVTDNVVRLRQENGGLRIIGIHERKLKE